MDNARNHSGWLRTIHPTSNVKSTEMITRPPPHPFGLRAESLTGYLLTG